MLDQPDVASTPWIFRWEQVFSRFGVLPPDLLEDTKHTKTFCPFYVFVALLLISTERVQLMT